MRHAAPMAAIVLGVLAAATAATAHITHESDDGAYFITIGQHGEPVYTFQRTNLDLIIRENVGGERGDEVPGVHETLTATIVAPGGEELDGELRTQFGAVGRYQFADGYTLTQPGVYLLRLQGSIGGSPVDGLYDMGHEVRSQSQIMFPHQGLPTLLDLGAENEALRSHVADLEARVQALEGAAPAEDRGSPSAAVPILVGGLAALAVAARRRDG